MSNMCADVEHPPTNSAESADPADNAVMHSLKRFLLAHPVWSVVALLFGSSLTIGWASPAAASVVWIGLSAWAIVWRHGAREKPQLPPTASAQAPSLPPNAPPTVPVTPASPLPIRAEPPAPTLRPDTSAGSPWATPGRANPEEGQAEDSLEAPREGATPPRHSFWRPTPEQKREFERHQRKQRSRPRAGKVANGDHYTGPTPRKTTGREARFFVVGADHHQGIKHLRPGRQPVIISREPTNKFDRNALRVWAGPGMGMVGFLSASVASKLAPYFDHADLAAIEAEGEFTPGDGLAVFIPGPNAGFWGRQPERLGKVPALPSDLHLWPDVVAPWGRCASFGQECDSENSKDAILTELSDARIHLQSEPQVLKIPVRLALTATQPTKIILVSNANRAVGILNDSTWLTELTTLDAEHKTVMIDATIWGVQDYSKTHTVVRASLPEHGFLLSPRAPTHSAARVAAPRYVDASDRRGELSERVVGVAGRRTGAQYDRQPAHVDETQCPGPQEGDRCSHPRRTNRGAEHHHDWTHDRYCRSVRGRAATSALSRRSTRQPAQGGGCT